MSKVGAGERARIVALLEEHGGNQNRVARIVGRHQATVGRIANAEGIDSVNAAPKKANAVRRAFAEIDRLEIVGLGLQTGADLLAAYKDRDPTPENIRAYKDLMMGVAIGVDKHLLLTGKPTSINETRKGPPSLEELFGGAKEEAAREWNRASD